MPSFPTPCPGALSSVPQVNHSKRTGDASLTRPRTTSSAIPVPPEAINSDLDDSDTDDEDPEDGDNINTAFCNYDKVGAVYDKCPIVRD